VTHPPIHWYCRECGQLCDEDPHLEPQDAPDAPFDHNPKCMAGYSMTMIARCSVCNHDLEHGDNLCIHFETEVVRKLGLLAEDPDP
jgi:hypothetical protein